jgi:hypothetical protein
MKQNVVKIVSISLIILVILNLTLFVMNKVNQTTFWTIIIVSALIAFKVIPGINKKSH